MSTLPNPTPQRIRKVGVVGVIVREERLLVIRRHTVNAADFDAHVAVLPRRPQGSRQVSREDRSLQSVSGVVREAKGIAGVAVGLDGDHRPEDR